MSHTPGPWHVSDDAQGPMMVFADQHGKAVCALTDIFSPSNGFIGDDEGVGRPTRTANARLIAAAPDLLALADDYLAFLVDTWHSMSQDDFEAHPTVVAVRAAIKKARGG
jgi:hypothetical protein